MISYGVINYLNKYLTFVTFMFVKQQMIRMKIQGNGTQNN